MNCEKFGYEKEELYQDLILFKSQKNICIEMMVFGKEDRNCILTIIWPTDLIVNLLMYFDMNNFQRSQERKYKLSCWTNEDLDVNNIIK